MPDGYMDRVAFTVPRTPRGISVPPGFSGRARWGAKEKAKTRQPNGLSPGFATSAPQMV